MPSNVKQLPLFARQRRVIKLGGSLLDIPRVADHLITLINSWPCRENFVVVGGGPAANMVREWDQALGLGEQRSHRMAIFAMTWNAKQHFLEHSNFDVLRNFQSVTDMTRPALILAESFLQSIADQRLIGVVSPPTLPESWDITSDSISAYVANLLGAEQLVLLKSVDCPESMVENRAAHQTAIRSPYVDVSGVDCLQALADAGFVDIKFPRYASRNLSVRWCNFRKLVDSSKR